MDDLVTFLRARLDEDYEVARLALGINAMARVRQGQPAPRWVPSPEGDAGIWDTDGTPHVKFVWARERDHIVRHDPARVLREVEARRELLSRYEAMAADVLVVTGREAILSEYRRIILPGLALPYATHPDYRDDWRP